jgi:hypothetical protein
MKGIYQIIIKIMEGYTQVTLIKNGSLVITRIGKVKAIVTGVCLRGENSIQYEISYFAEGKHQSTWVYPIEFDLDLQVKGQIGLLPTKS